MKFLPLLGLLAALFLLPPAQAAHPRHAHPRPGASHHGGHHGRHHHGRHRTLHQPGKTFLQAPIVTSPHNTPPN